MNSFEAIKRYYSNKKNGKPLYVSIEITQNCNADCGFCGYRRSNNDGMRILETKSSYLDELLGLNPVAVGFVGGEPLIRKDLENLVKEAKTEANIPYVQITTNGSFLTIPRYNSLSEAGLDRLNISLDFLGKDHDNARGLNGLYSKIITFLDECRNHDGARIGLSTIVMKENFSEIPSIIQFAKEYGLQVTLMPYSPVRVNSNLYSVSIEDFIPGILTKLKKENPSTIMNSKIILENGEEFLRTGRYGKCDAGNSFLWILPNGKLRACIDHKESECRTLDLIRKFKEHNSCNRCYLACRSMSETVSSSKFSDLIKIGIELSRSFTCHT